MDMVVSDLTAANNKSFIEKSVLNGHIYEVNMTFWVSPAYAERFLNNSDRNSKKTVWLINSYKQLHLLLDERG